MKNGAILSWLLAFVMTVGALPGLQAQTAKPGVISGSVYNDLNKDAKEGEEDTEAEGQTVKLYRILPDGKREFVGSVTTDASGNYRFDSLVTGTYVLIFEFSTGVTVESAKPIVLTEASPTFSPTPVPVLPQNYKEIYGPLVSSPLPGSPLGSPVLEVLNLRNPANVTGEEVSRFVP